MAIKDKFFKQHRVRFIGPVIDVIYITMPLFGAVSYVMTAITMYTVIQPWLRQTLPWMRLWIFFTGVFIFCFCLLLVMYKFVYPSYFSFRNKQEYSHENLIRRDLEAIKKKLGIE